MTQDTNTTRGAADLRAEVAMIDAAMVEMTNITPPLKRSECARLIRAALAAGQATAAQQGAAYAALPDDREAFKTYLKECDECAIVPDVAGAFNAAWQIASHGQAPAQSEVVPECHYGPLRDADAEWGRQLSVYATLPRAADTQQAPAQAAPAYKDSTPELHVGDSAFESWYSSYNPTHKGDKQRAHDAYAAGMGDPLVMAAPAAVAGPWSTGELDGNWLHIDHKDHAVVIRIVWKMEGDARNPVCEARAMAVIAALNAYAAPTTQPAPQQEAGKAVHQFRKQYCADWYDGRADHGDSGGPYEERTLYTVPQPTAQGDALDAARYRWLRDQSFDEWKRIAWHVSGRSHAIWEDRYAAIDKAIAARKQGANHDNP